MKFKTQGKVNWAHVAPWTETHQKDAQRQTRFKRRARTRASKTLARLQAKVRHAEEKLVQATAKFPHFGLGTVWARTMPFNTPTPPLGQWTRFSHDNARQFAEWIACVGDWHSGYLTKAGAPEFFETSAKSDARFIYATVLVSPWHSAAIAKAQATGELTVAQSHDLLSRMLGALTDGTLEERASCGAERKLRLAGIACHPEDGVLHLHPIFVKAERLVYVLPDGSEVPRSRAPTLRGKKTAGSGWSGGARLGNVGTTGKLVLNSLGPALCAADHMRVAGLPPPVDRGENWDFLDAIIKKRSAGNIPGKKERENAKEQRARSTAALGEPFDLWASRAVREVIEAFANGHPALGRRIHEEKTLARKNATTVNRMILDLIAGKEMKSIALLFAPLLEKIRDGLERLLDGRDHSLPTDWLAPRSELSTVGCSLVPALRRQIEILAEGAGATKNRAKEVIGLDDECLAPLPNDETIRTAIFSLRRNSSPTEDRRLAAQIRRLASIGEPAAKSLALEYLSTAEDLRRSAQFTAGASLGPTQCKERKGKEHDTLGL